MYSGLMNTQKRVPYRRQDTSVIDFDVTERLVIAAIAEDARDAYLESALPRLSASNAGSKATTRAITICRSDSSMNIKLHYSHSY